MGVNTMEDVEGTAAEPGCDERLTRLAKEYAKGREVAAAAATAKMIFARRAWPSVMPARSAANPFLISVTAQNRTSLDSAAPRVGAAQAGFDLNPYEKVSASNVLRVIA